MSPQIQTTPGGRRSRNTEKAYVPFNPKPKDVGTRTGQAMPTNVPLNEDGFEDPDEFFKSPNGSEHPLNRSIMSTVRKSIHRTPPTTASTVGLGVGSSRNTRRGRMNALGGDGDSGDEVGEDLLGDDGDELDRMRTPAPFFTDEHNPPPSVTLPSRSRPFPPSPSISTSYDDLPSPAKRRKSTIGVAYDPSKSTQAKATPRANVIHSPALEPGIDLGDDELNDGLSPNPVVAEKENEKRGRKSGTMDIEHGRNAMGRLSMASRKSGKSFADEDEDEDEEDDGVGAGAGAGLTSIRFDGDESVDLGGADMGGFGGMEDSRVEDEVDQNVDVEEEEGQVDADDDVGLEERAVAEENEEESEDDERQRNGSEPVRRVKSKPGRIQVRTKRAPWEKSEKISQEKKKSRVSRLPNEDEEEAEYQGDFKTRRSGRAHFKPLAFWRGEKFEYQRGEFLPVIKEVVHIPEEPVIPFGAKRRAYRSGRSASHKPTMNGTHEPEEAGWDAATDAIGLVNEFPSGKEIHRRIAYTKSMLNPKSVDGSQFMYQKIFGEGQFIAAGVVHIPPGGKKPGKHSKDNAYVFYVGAGAVQVKIHRTTFIMAPGASFMVPRGNEYSIENISPTTIAELFFSQARKIQKTDEEEEAAENMSQVGIGKRKGSSAPTDAGEETEEEGASVKKKGKRR